MTPDQLQAYIRQIGDLMGLKDWKLELMERAAEPDNGAEMCSVYGRKIAQIRVALDFNNYSPQDQRYFVVHELTHAHFEQMDQMLNATMRTMLGSVQFPVWQQGYMTLMEYGVDGMAQALSEYMPLPEQDMDTGVLEEIAE